MEVITIYSERQYKIRSTEYSIQLIMREWEYDGDNHGRNLKKIISYIYLILCTPHRVI